MQPIVSDCPASPPIAALTILSMKEDVSKVTHLLTSGTPTLRKRGRLPPGLDFLRRTLDGKRNTCKYRFDATPFLLSCFHSMKNTISRFVVAAAAAGLIGATAMAAVKQGKTRILKTSQLMGGVVKPHCTAIKDALKEAPADDDAWADLAMHAAILNEVSFTLMADGRCPDKVWADAVKTQLAVGSEAVAKAAEAKDVEAARAAFKTLTASCKACHKEHKED